MAFRAADDRPAVIMRVRKPSAPIHSKKVTEERWPDLFAECKKAIWKNMQDCDIVPHLTLGEQQNGWNPLDKRVSAVALVFKMLYGVLYFKIFFSFLLSAFGS